MKQSYTKDQHAYAKEHGMAMVTIGWDGRYLPKPGGAAERSGPVDAQSLKEVKALFLKLCKRNK